MIAAKVFVVVAFGVFVGLRVVLWLLGLLWRRLRGQGHRRGSGIIAPGPHGRRRRAGRVRRWLSARMGAASGMWGLVAVNLLAVLYIAVQPPDAAGPGATSRSGGPARLVEGRVTHVRDGDTIEVDGLPVRLANLDCAELGTVRGDRAAARMRALAGGRSVRCRLSGARSYDRWIGRCALPDGGRLSGALVQDGICEMW